MKLKNLAILMVALLISVVLAACNDSDEQEQGTQSDNGSGEPQAGGTLVRALIYGDPQNLDPVMLSHGTTTSMVTWNIFEPLIRYDAVKGEMVPANAEKWEISDDGTTYTFHLKKGVKFHNGREVKAEDFKYSFERLANPKTASPNGGSLQSVVGYQEFLDGAADFSGIKVVDEYTLQLTIQKPDSTFLTTLSLPYFSAMPKEVIEEKGDQFGAEPIGAGPFKFKSWTRDSEIVLEANKDYHAGAPYLNEVVYKILTDQAARDSSFLSGQIDMMVLGEAQYAQFLNNADYKDNLVEVPELYIRNLRYNLNAEGPWQDVRVRQAISHAIDSATIINSVLGGKAYPATGPLPSSIKGYNENLKGYEYDPEKAKALLKEAGYENGFTLPILASSHSAFGVPAVEAMIGYLEEVGIKVEIEQADLVTVLDRMANGDFDTAMMSNGGWTDAVNFLSIYFHSKNGGSNGNAGYYSNPEVDKLLDQALASTDDNEIIELVQKAEEIIVSEAPMWFFNYNKAVLVTQPWVKGLEPVPTDIDYQDLTKVWIDESAK